MVKLETIVIDDLEHTILIGQNAQENSALVKKCEPEDIWFHLKNSSSPHVILQTQSRPIQKKHLNKVAALVYQSTRKPTREPVIYTEIKNVKLTCTPGLVIPSKTKEIRF